MEQNKETWEVKTDALINVWKKYYSEKSSICPDCGGLTWQVCEKSLREMLGAYVRRVDKELLLQRQNNVREILETLSAPEMHCTLDQTKALRIHAQGFNVAIDIIKDYIRIFAKEKGINI